MVTLVCEIYQQTVAEYDFPIAATKSDVFKFCNNATFDIVLLIHPMDLIKQKTFEKNFTIFEKNALSQEGMMIIEL
jgi:hypothetical protein